jgi:hypothetical protein
MYPEKHPALFSAIRKDIINNIRKEHRDNALQLKSMRDFKADWTESFFEIPDMYPYTLGRKDSTVEFGIAFKRPGEIQLILDVYSYEFWEALQHYWAFSPNRVARERLWPYISIPAYFTVLTGSTE